MPTAKRKKSRPAYISAVCALILILAGILAVFVMYRHNQALKQNWKRFYGHGRKLQQFQADARRQANISGKMSIQK